MSTVVRRSSRKSPKKEYQELLFELLPDQGQWTEEEYLWLTEDTNRFVEFTDGYLEPLPMPTDKHQGVLEFLFLLFLGHVKPLGGTVHLAVLRMRIRKGKFREPDMLLVKDAKDSRRRNRFWLGADLALEVVSKEKRERDPIDKRGDYAEGKVPEYWIVNPQAETITVLRLEGEAYVEHGVFRRGDIATSVVLPGFSVQVSQVFDVESPPDDDTLDE
jgi:Uma2 family endonuclease